MRSDAGPMPNASRAIEALDNAIEPLQGLRDVLARLDDYQVASGELATLSAVCTQAAANHLAEAVAVIQELGRG